VCVPGVDSQAGEGAANPRLNAAMGAFGQRGGWGVGCVVFAGAFCWSTLLCAETPQRLHVTGEWASAVDARAAFEAEPAGTHTRAEYARVMDGFRAIYHESPADSHAPRAVEQVAELLTEQGHELGDAKSLKDAAGQYDFLLGQYAQSSAAHESRGKADELRAEMESPARPKSAAKLLEEAAQPATDVSPAVVDHYRAPSHKAAVVSPIPMPDEDAAAAALTPVDAAANAATANGTNANPARKMALVSAIRHWSTPTYTRVAIDLGDAVEYQAARVENPDRIYFDLHHARLAQALSGKSFAIPDDGFLTKIRAAQYSNDVTRVVLDVHEVGEYSAFLLPNPYRLIIDIHGKDASAKAAAESADVSAAPAEVAATQPAATQGATTPPTGTEVSSLPPMAVTDGSASFGLPAKSARDVQPRVVVTSRPTAAKPVPNTVASKSLDAGSDVAAVSLQPGRVEATRRPTSGPIAERTAAKAVAAPHVAGEPVEAAAPTAEGETSLMRALGLKIGRIVIDAGHGGHDSGTLGADGIEEKDVVLDVALRLGKLLHDRLGAEIVYTRADDTFIPLETRTAIANKAQADLFLSVHANSSSDPTARGVEVYYLNFTSDPVAMQVASRENAVSTQSVHELSDLVKKIALKDKIDESKELASDVDASLYAGLEKGNGGLKNRGVKKAPFVVLIGANMPSILAEISFVTNPKDASELQTPEYRERVAESLFAGVKRYAEGINGTAPRRSHMTATERAAR
jgi:N-acetylmuramoyl-L-alanine amidase